MNKNISFIALLILLQLSACATVPLPREQVDYLDLEAFDRQLAASLQTKPEVRVLIHGKVPLEAIPPRLQNWLAATDGVPTVEEVRVKSQGNENNMPPIVLALFDIVGSDVLVNAYQAVHDKLLYAPAHDYQAVIRYEGGACANNPNCGLIREVVFVKRRAE